LTGELVIQHEIIDRQLAIKDLKSPIT